jgi:hypothetical protein
MFYLCLGRRIIGKGENRGRKRKEGTRGIGIVPFFPPFFPPHFPPPDFFRPKQRTPAMQIMY